MKSKTLIALSIVLSTLVISCTGGTTEGSTETTDSTQVVKDSTSTTDSTVVKKDSTAAKDTTVKEAVK
jgi:hypothetical protein